MGIKVLLTGGSGQLGLELRLALANLDPVDLVFSPSSAELNLADRNSVRSAIVGMRPNWIVHAGAWTQVDACEDDPERAFLINGLGTRFVVQAAEEVGARVCYISTDYVFDGTSQIPYREWDSVGPKTVYGSSKLAGEMELRPLDLTVRTSWVMGLGGANMAKTLLRLAGSGDLHRFVDDQVGSPTIVRDLVRVIAALVVEEHSGIFHVSNAGQCSWYDVAAYVFEVLGENPGRILPVKTEDLGGYRAPRPRYSVLDNFALRHSSIDPLPDWRDSLKWLVKELSKGAFPQ